MAARSRPRGWPKNEAWVSEGHLFWTPGSLAPSPLLNLGLLPACLILPDLPLVRAKFSGKGAPETQGVLPEGPACAALSPPSPHQAGSSPPQDGIAGGGTSTRTDQIWASAEPVMSWDCSMLGTIAVSRATAFFLGPAPFAGTAEGMMSLEHLRVPSPKPSPRVSKVTELKPHLPVCGAGHIMSG